jgi:hypothetical protein
MIENQPDLSQAIANTAAVFKFNKVRFSILTPRLIRLESSPSGIYEDRPSQQFWYRCQQVPAMQVTPNKHLFRVETEVVRLTYHDTLAGLTPQTLEIVVKENGVIYNFDDPNPYILPGTARTLDETSGPVQLQPGLISRSGWAMLDDTPSLVFNNTGWLEQRPLQAGYRDLYFLASANNYKAALQDYQRIAGTPPLLPRALLGNWWSRFWEYSQDEVQCLVEHFEEERIPLSTFIIDMDWHITKTGNTCSGWTGFSWNRRLFPDPPGLFDWLHEHELLTSLNLHPAEGIHPLEEQGVDFWWIDWQQGDHTSLPSLDPLWWLNHLHFYDLARNPNKRPIIFSRWGGPGNHRYPIGFSGDTVISWKTLAYQPYFTATAANAAYGWWSHDIGGHMRGMEDGELYTRWVQFGVLSPIFRLHCGKDVFIDRQPWAFDKEVLELTRRAMQFRHALVPYLYTMARRNEVEGLPLITPLYYAWPEEESAYQVGNEYLLGSELLAVPVTSPINPDLNQCRTAIWFPPNEWFDFFNGEHHHGSQWKIKYFALDEIPLFARAGAIVPLQNVTTRNGCPNPNFIDLLVFPGKSDSFTLYEDDGVSQGYLQNGGCNTEFNSIWTDHSLSIHISPAEGDTKCVPQNRTYRLLFRGVEKPDGINAVLRGETLILDTTYDEANRTVTVGPVELQVNQTLLVEIHTERRPLLAQNLTVEEKVIRFLKRARMESLTKWRISTTIDKLKKDPASLSSSDLTLSQSHQIALTEIMTDAGAVEIDLPQGGSRLLLVNPNQLKGFKCRSKIPFNLEPEGVLLPESLRPVLVDYFGLIRKKF